MVSFDRISTSPGVAYAAPSSVAEAASLLAEHGDEAKLLAGGQSLLMLLHHELIAPQLLIDLRRVPELQEIERTADGGLRIGAMVTQRRLERAEAVRSSAPALTQAARAVATIPIRNLGTLGGNVCHGEIGSDSPGALIALGAAVEAVSPRGTRRIPVEELYRGYLETILAPDELVTALVLPPAPAGSGQVYLKLRRRAVDFAIVGIAVLLSVDTDGRCTGARIGMNGVDATPRRAVSAEAVLRGEVLTPAGIAAAAAAALDDTDPMTDGHASAAYRRRLVPVFVRRALEQARELAGPGGATPLRWT